MEYGAIDLHKVKSQIRIVDEDGHDRARDADRDVRAEFARVFGAAADAGAAGEQHGE